jgi:hypothetical protein
MQIGALWLINILTLSIELRPLLEHMKVRVLRRVSILFVLLLAMPAPVY